MRYHAFISYSHSDARWASWLHRALERFHIPSAVKANHNLAVDRLRPIFKDDQELGAASDLTEAIREGLDASDALIVVCSPRARESCWIDREIEVYIENHGPQRIFCLMVQGTADEALPASLARAGLEPLAVSPTQGGKRQAINKLAAALLDVPYADLAQRDLQYRNRRLVWISAASIAGMVLATGLAWFAYISRAEAQTARQQADLRRTQAEELIDFMLGDLRKKLEPIGRLDVLADVNKQVAHYFASFGNAKLSPEDRLHRARAMHQIGEVRFKSGDFAGARVAFKVTLHEMQRLQRQSPDDTKVIYELGQAHYWVGFANWYDKRVDAAAGDLDAYLAISKQLVAKDPSNVEWQTELGWAESNLGTLANARGDLKAALGYFEESARIFEALEKRTGEARFKFELSSTLSWLGTVHRNLGQLQMAYAVVRRQARILEGLNAQTDNAGWRYSHVMALRHLGELEIDQGKLAAAKVTLTRAQHELEKLRSLDPANMHWQFGDAIVSNLLANALVFDADVAGASAARDHAAEIVDRLLDKDPGNVRWQQARLNVLVTSVRIDIAGGVASKEHRDIVDLLAEANTDHQTDSIAAVWGEIFRAEAALTPGDREAAAALALRRMDAGHLNGESPDTVVPRFRAMLAKGVPAEMLKKELERYTESGLMHPGLRMISGSDTGRGNRHFRGERP